MRRIPKYKVYCSTKTFLVSCSRKVFGFKHSKWHGVKRIFRKSKRRSFYNFSKRSVIQNKMVRYKTSVKYLYLIRRCFKQFYDNAFTTKFIKKSYLRARSHSKFYLLKFFSHFFVRMEYRLDILLYRLNFFSSIHESRNFIRSGVVTVNSNPTGFGYVVKKGDIIQLNHNIYLSKEEIKKKLRFKVYVPYAEADYYTNTVVIVKNYFEVCSEELSVLFAPTVKLEQLHKAIYKI